MHNFSLSNQAPIAIKNRIQISCAGRGFSSIDGTDLIIDDYGSGITSTFIRLKENQAITLTLDDAYQFSSISAGGFLGVPEDKSKPILWIPELPVSRKINSEQAILEERAIFLAGFSWSKNKGASFLLQSCDSAGIDFVIWQLPPDFSIDELRLFSPIEKQGAFLWGSHGCIKKPGDLYRHLINGAVYDLRFSWPHNKKCFSENEAHALYTVFAGLEKTTGKSLYRLFQLQIVLSVIQRQSEDGGFYHGMWTDETECHYRLHASAVYLLLDEFQRTGCKQTEAALKKAVQFLSKTTDQLNCGTWFLHDSLELSEKAMNSGPFNWIPNRTLGKSVSNMLVLNTHLDTTIAINRYGQLTGDLQYQPLVDSALQSTRAVLNLQPANWLYKPLFWAIGLTMIPTEKAQKLSAPVRAIKRLAWQYLTKKLPDIKARFPRLVMPNGYIDRELSLRTWAIDYQTINLMDLARYARAFPGEFDESILDKAMEFTQTSGLLVRYQELQPGKRYAPGFWMEALYHRCLEKRDLKYRVWLSESMLMCHRLGLGLAPSLLGANGEALGSQISSISSPNRDELLFANLCCGNYKEILLVNSSDKPCLLDPLAADYGNFTWTDASNASLAELQIPANSWIRGVGQ